MTTNILTMKFSNFANRANVLGLIPPPIPDPPRKHIVVSASLTEFNAEWPCNSYEMNCFPKLLLSRVPL